MDGCHSSLLRSGDLFTLCEGQAVAVSCGNVNHHLLLERVYDGRS